MLKDDRPTAPSRRLPLVALAGAAALLAFLIVPRVLLQNTHTTLVSPVDHGALAWIILAGIVLSQLIFWSLFGRSIVKGRDTTAGAGLAIIGLLFAVPFVIAAALFSPNIYDAYVFRGASPPSREKLYVIEDVSSAGRGGPSARVNPYGMGRIALPLSRAQYARYLAPLPTGQLLCYRVSEQRQGTAIRIVQPHRQAEAAERLIPCVKDAPGVVMNTTSRNPDG